MLGLEKLTRLVFLKSFRGRDSTTPGSLPYCLTILTTKIQFIHTELNRKGLYELEGHFQHE